MATITPITIPVKAAIVGGYCLTNMKMIAIRGRVK